LILILDGCLRSLSLSGSGTGCSGHDQAATPAGLSLEIAMNGQRTMLSSISMTEDKMERAKLRYLLYEAIVELEYVQCADDHSQCASAKGRRIVKRGMELLKVKDLSKESLIGS